MRDIFITRLTDLAQQDRKLALITGDLGFGVFDNYRKLLPAQFINAGVCEQQMTMLATGMALEGWTVFTYSIGNFPTLRPLEMVRNDAAYHGANVKIVCIGGGFSYGALGPSHHATEDVAIMRALPDITVAVPSGPWEVGEATEAIYRAPGTAYLRLDKGVGDDRPRPGEIFRLGKARVIRDGSDVTFVTSGSILHEVQQAAKALSADGIESRVVTMPTIKPLDLEVLRAAAVETGGIVTVEEHSLHGGLGGAVAEALLDNSWIPDQFLRIGLGVGFSSIVGTQEYLRSSYQMDASAIASRTMALLRRPK